MTAAEAAALLGLGGGTVRKYCRAVGLSKTNGQYDIDPEMVEEWRHNPPTGAHLRVAVVKVRKDPLDGPPIKTYISERVPNVQDARRARKIRLLDAMRRAGI